MDNKRLNNRIKLCLLKIEKLASKNANLINFFLLLYQVKKRNALAKKNAEEEILNKNRSA